VKRPTPFKQRGKGKYQSQLRKMSKAGSLGPFAIVSKLGGLGNLCLRLRNSIELNLTGNLVQTTCLLFDHEVVVLYDSGATHSFVSNKCVRRLGLVMRELACELIVATPASGEVSTTCICVGCPMKVVGRKFKVTLICLLMEGLDVILGMDWLANNHVVIDCEQCIVVFPYAEGLELISLNQAVREIEVGATCFMIAAQAEKKSTEEQISMIPVVDEYGDVFPYEIPELSPSKDVDFTINLIPEAGRVSMAPYRMAPAELAELKKQIEDLLEKKFIRASASPWGSPMLLVKKKDDSSRLCVNYRS